MSENKLFIPPSVEKNLSVLGKKELSSMTELEQGEFVEQYCRNAKSTGVGYVLWFLLGCHYAYVGKWGLQCLFWLTLGGFFIWWVIDAFRIPGMIAEQNRDVSMDVIRNIKVLSK